MISDLENHVILCNFGGPTKEEEVKPFLTKLFEDPFIIRAPLGPFRPLLARRIAKKRAPESAKEYAKIGFSPINKMTNIQAEQLAEILKKKNANTKVHVINRYTPPFAEEVIPTIPKEGSRIFILTLYPHFCHSTTATSLREVDHAMRAQYGEGEVANTRIYSWWHHPSYLKYSTEQLKKQLEIVLPKLDNDPLSIVFSAHGIPKRYRDRGDPYVTETTAHFNQIKSSLDGWIAESIPEKKDKVHWHLCYQSRVGPVEWTRPYTDETIVELGKKRGGHLLLYPISFTSDHIETLYEMDVTYKGMALEAGFKDYHRVMAANEDKEFTQCLADILDQHGF